ncbi:MAG: J domain-containing protein [Rhodothermales bacterium]|nr:J domain-containing protein [Rhodothermales bacterium]
MKQYFDILELQPGATPEEVKAAYRDLAKVWHPDRFEGDSRLKSKAAEKLAEINDAYEKIRAYQARQRARADANATQRPIYPSASETEQPGTTPDTTGIHQPGGQRPSNGASGAYYSGYRRPTNGQSGRRRPAERPSNAGSFNAFRDEQKQNSWAESAANSNPSSTGAKARGWAAPASLTRRRASIQYGRFGNAYTNPYRRTRSKRSPVILYLSAGILLILGFAAILFFTQREDRVADTSWIENLEKEAQAGSLARPAAGRDETPLADPDSADLWEVEAGGANDEPRASAARRRLAPAVPPGYFTLGSSKADVVAAQGQPDIMRDNLFRYGFSQVVFDDGRVVGWHQAPERPLMVRLLPFIYRDGEFFTVGSTRDEIISIHGTPDRYGEDGREMMYGKSRITFERGRVINWHQTNENPLNARLLPGSRTSATYFTLRSTKDEVVAAQGSPDSFNENTLHYGYSTISFRDGRVVGWHQSPSNPLNVILEPSRPTSSISFAVGSTRDEVIAAQGTPDQYTDRMLKYGHSTISFENERVVSFYESATSPLKVAAESRH